MTPLVTKTLMVNTINPVTGAAHNPPKLVSKDVQTFDLDYGRHRRERQEKERQARNTAWRAMSPQQQLNDLNKRLGEGVGAAKQRARIAAKLTQKAEAKQERPANTANNQNKKPKSKAKNHNKPQHHKHNHAK